MAGVAREQLVAAHAAHDHGQVLAGRLADQERRQGRRVGDRLVHVPDDARQLGGQRGVEDGLLMARAERFGDLRSQVVRCFLAALRRDDAADLYLEGEPLGARRALVEVTRDRAPLPDGELAIEVLVDDTRSVELTFDQGQQAGELREDEGLVPLFDDFA